MTATVISLALPEHADDLPTGAGSTTLPGLPGWFCLHYQSELDLHSGAISRCEALLRWHHPEFGLLRPHATLAGTRWAEQVDDLDAWALEEAARQTASWDRAGHRVQTAVNLSASFLVGPHLTRALDHALAASGAAPGLLAVDLPFGLVATRPAEVQELVGDLAGAEVAVIVDGVAGDAHPPLIDRLEAEAWKIDLGNHQPGRPRALHRSVEQALHQAHQTGARAIAKAVEDERQLSAIRRLGFDGAFGDLLGPPAPPDETGRRFRPPSPPRRPLFGPRNGNLVAQRYGASSRRATPNETSDLTEPTFTVRSPR